jgi:hypothetical protein
MSKEPPKLCSNTSPPRQRCTSIKKISVQSLASFKEDPAAAIGTALALGICGAAVPAAALPEVFNQHPLRDEVSLRLVRSNAGDSYKVQDGTVALHRLSSSTPHGCACVSAAACALGSVR